MAAFTIPSIFTAVDKFSPIIKAMNNSVASFSDKSEAHIARVERSFRKLQDVSRNIAIGAGLLGAAILAPLGIAAQSAVGFEKKMSNVATLIDTNTESMSAMGREVLEISTRMPVAIEDLTTSLYDIRSAGIPAAAAMQTLESSVKLSVSGLSTASEATNIMTSAINAFKSEGKSAEEISDILFKTVKFGKTTVSELASAFGSTAPIVQSAGVTLADFQAATAALTTVGTPATQAQTQLRAAVVALQKPSEDMTKIFKKLGVATEKELIEKFGGLGGAFEAVNAQGKAMRINLSKAWSSVEASAAVTSLTGATNEAYVQTLKDMTTGTNAVDEAFKKQSETAAAQQQLMKNNMEALSITVGTQLIPTINELIKSVAPMIEGFVKWAGENPELLSTILKVAGGIGVLSLIVSGAATVVSIFSGIMQGYGLIVRGVGAITKLYTSWQLLFNGVMGLSVAPTTAAAGATTGLGVATNFALIPIIAIVAAIAALIAVVVLIIKKWNDWGAAISMFIPILGFIISLVQSFRRNWDMLVEAFQTGGIIGALKAIGKIFIDAILMPLQQLLTIASKLPGKAGEWAATGAEKIEAFRNNLGVNTTTDESGNPLPEKKAVNLDEARQQSLKETITTNKQNVAIDINDNTGRAKVESDNNLIPINLTSTMLWQ